MAAYGKSGCKGGGGGAAAFVSTKGGSASGPATWKRPAAGAGVYVPPPAKGVTAAGASAVAGAGGSTGGPAVWQRPAGKGVEKAAGGWQGAGAKSGGGWKGDDGGWESPAASGGWKGGALGPGKCSAGKGGAGKGWGGGGAAAAWVSKPAKNWGGGVKQDPNEDFLWSAVSEAVMPILHMEDELDQSKLEKRIRDAFKKGAKGLSFNASPWHALVEEFADNAMGCLFSSCGEKAWVTHIDLLLCMDAAIRDHFPPQVLRNVPQLEFEQCVLAAYDRSFEEQRVGPIIWEAVQTMVEGPKAKKKVFNSCEIAFKQSRTPAGHYPNAVQDFVAQFIDLSIANLSGESQGEPQWVLDPKLATQFFMTLIDTGVVPFPLVQEHGPPPSGDPFVGYCVHEAYCAHDSSFGKGAGKGWARTKKRKNRQPGNYSTEATDESAQNEVALAEAVEGEEETGAEEPDAKIQKLYS